MPGPVEQLGYPPALILEQVEECWKMDDEGAEPRRIARVMNRPAATAKAEP